MRGKGYDAYSSTRLRKHITSLSVRTNVDELYRYQPNGIGDQVGHALEQPSHGVTSAGHGRLRPTGRGRSKSPLDEPAKLVADSSSISNPHLSCRCDSRWRRTNIWRESKTNASDRLEVVGNSLIAQTLQCTLERAANPVNQHTVLHGPVLARNGICCRCPYRL